MHLCARGVEDTDTQEVECYIHGYHVYQELWEAAAIDEEPVCRPEWSSGYDEEWLVVGHPPSKFSHLYTQSDDAILCHVAEKRWYSRDLLQICIFWKEQQKLK